MLQHPIHMLRISIPTPCHEDWNKMSPREQGAFCSVCAKTVVDFTVLSDEQVKNYFLDNAGKNTCGRFRKEQLAEDADFLPRLLSHNIPVWKKFVAAVFILFSSFMTSCTDTKGKIVPEENKEELLGLIGSRSTDGPKTDTLIEMGELKSPPLIQVSEAFPPPLILGDVEIVEMVTGTTCVFTPDTLPTPIVSPPDPETDLTPIRKEKTDSLKKPEGKECEPGKDSLIYFKPE